MHHMLTSLYANISKPDIEPAELDNECCIPSLLVNLKRSDYLTAFNNITIFIPITLQLS
jgi:hypothetical protein